MNAGVQRASVPTLSINRQLAPKEGNEIAKTTVSKAFEPVDLLNTQMAGATFSLNHILSTSQNEPQASAVPSRLDDNPISAGLVDIVVAKSLFEG